MTRFLLSLNEAVNVIFTALTSANRGEIYIPRVPASRITDIAKILIGDRNIPIVVTGIRPGEKVHEILISEEECRRTVQRGNYYVIKSILPELQRNPEEPIALTSEYSSSSSLMNFEETYALLKREDLLIPEEMKTREELLR